MAARSATTRIAGVSKKAALRLLVEAGDACWAYQDRVLTNLETRRVQLDEVWTWLECKAKNVTPEIMERNPNAGDCWLWVAMDADSRLVFAWRVGARDRFTGKQLCEGRGLAIEESRADHL